MEGKKKKGYGVPPQKQKMLTKWKLVVKTNSEASYRLFISDARSRITRLCIYIYICKYTPGIEHITHQGKNENHL